MYDAASDSIFSSVGVMQTLNGNDYIVSMTNLIQI